MVMRLGIRGVNLGGWLVYEKWMQSPWLAGIEAEDDYERSTSRDKDWLGDVLTPHFKGYITESDFRWMAENGVDTVRLPVPYHLFGTEHHISCVEYVDDAMEWAGRYGLGVLLDLHTVPMGQNAFDNSGYTGMCRWHMSRNRVLWTLDLLQKIAERYTGHRAFWGLQPLNEPAADFQMKSNWWKNGKRHPERVRVSSAMPIDRLAAFYGMFVERVRPILGDGVRLVLHDRFELWKWNDFMKMPQAGLEGANVWIDTHKYVFIKERKFKDSGIGEYEKACRQCGNEVARAQAHHPTIVGEWCLGNSSPDQSVEWYRAFSREQLAAWDRGEGGFFWSYRNDAPGFENWSFRDCVKRGWLDFKD